MPTSGMVSSKIDPSVHLTKRHVDILVRSHSGIFPKKIATELGLSYETVVEHVDRAARAFGTHGRVRRLSAAISHGFIHVSLQPQRILKPTSEQPSSMPLPRTGRMSS